MTQKLPPLPELFDPYDEEIASEYGRQCWNAAIEAAIDTWQGRDHPDPDPEMTLRPLQIDSHLQADSTV